MTTYLSPAALAALKEALCAAYWYKGDLRGFLQECLSDPTVLATLDWDDYRSQIASDLVDHLVRGEDKNPGELLRLCHDLCSFTTLVHLEHLDDADPKAQRAKAAIAQLRTLVEPQQQLQKERDGGMGRKKKAR
jgi:hypothetical protein